MPALIAMGVRVSPLARSAAPNRITAARKGMGAHTMAKYRLPSRRSDSSAPSQPGRKGLMASVIAPSAAPTTAAIITDCAAMRRARS